MPASAPDRPPRIVIRADGSASIGLGHVMRCLTLARALCDLGCRVRLEGAGLPEDARADLPSTLVLAVRSDVRGDAVDAASLVVDKPDLVVIDGYHFTAEFFSVLDDAGVPYAVIDDNGETAAAAPVLVLNQNPHAAEGLYRHMQGEPELLLGLGYALIRPEITRMAQERPQRVPETVFVAMGGSDPLELTAPIATAVAATGSQVLVALGSAHPSRDAVVQRLTSLPNVAIVEPEAYVRTLAFSEVAVLAAGSSLWEAACLGTPTIGVVVAENQRQGANVALKSGLLDGVHDPASDSLESLVDQVSTRAGAVRAANTGQGSIDGNGATRVAAALVSRLRDTSLVSASGSGPVLLPRDAP